MMGLGLPYKLSDTLFYPTYRDYSIIVPKSIDR
jgi:hypothetical protein